MIVSSGLMEGSISHGAAQLKQLLKRSLNIGPIAQPHRPAAILCRGLIYLIPPHRGENSLTH